MAALLVKMHEAVDDYVNSAENQSLATKNWQRDSNIVWSRCQKAHLKE